MQERILLIETSTSVCSIALAQADTLLAYKELPEPRMHSALLAPLIQELLQEQGLHISDCNAIAVSEGPGSYTGLRVGVSTAKGLCFGSGKPLIAVNSLQVMAQNALDRLKDQALPLGCLIIPLMDARRMEVYTASYRADGLEQICPPQPKIIDETSFREACYQDKTLIFTGDAVEKCRPFLERAEAQFLPLAPTADGLRIAAFQAFIEQRFASLAYFEPCYLK